MSKTSVFVLNSVECKVDNGTGDSLCYQKVIYQYDDGANSQPCYRFIRRGSDGKLRAQRGQAAIPSSKVAIDLIEKMRLEETESV